MLTMTCVLSGCGLSPTAIISAISATANGYTTYLDHQRKVYSKQCLWDGTVLLDEGFEDRLTEQERRDILTKNEQWDELCN